MLLCDVSHGLLWTARNPQGIRWSSDISRKRLASDEARGWWPVLISGIPLFWDVYASEGSARLDAQHAACAFTIIEAGRVRHLL